MPKIVDHDRRRAEIAEAAEQILVRDGLHGVTLRGIAALTGWSVGSVRHYFPEQHSLRAYVAQATATRLHERVRSRISAPRTSPSVIERIASITEELLPLDDERRTEYALWAALVEWERAVPPEQHSDIWNDQRALYRRCIVVLTDHPDAGHHGPLPILDERREAWAGYLHVLIDGLAAQLIHTPDKVPPETAKALVRSFLTEATRLRWDQPPAEHNDT